jgi:hypothetical protein
MASHSRGGGRVGRVAKWVLGLIACAGAVVVLVEAALGSQRSPERDTADATSPFPGSTPAARPLRSTSAERPEDAADSATPTTISFRVPSSDPLVEGLTQDLVSSQSSSPVALTEPEARCVAYGMLARVGADVLADLGRRAPDGTIDIAALSPTQQDQFASAAVDCVDVRLMLAPQLGAAGLSPGDISCVADQLIQDGTLARMLRQSVVTGLDTAAAELALTTPMANALQRCQPGNEPSRTGRPS